MPHKPVYLLLAAIQAILDWESLISGGTKLLSGTFPQNLADTISSLLKEKPDGWYVSFQQHTILPHSALYEHLIEWTEVTIGSKRALRGMAAGIVKNGGKSPPSEEKRSLERSGCLVRGLATMAHSC